MISHHIYTQFSTSFACHLPPQLSFNSKLYLKNLHDYLQSDSRAEGRFKSEVKGENEGENEI